MRQVPDILEGAHVVSDVGECSGIENAAGLVAVVDVGVEDIVHGGSAKCHNKLLWLRSCGAR